MAGPQHIVLNSRLVSICFDILQMKSMDVQYCPSTLTAAEIAQQPTLWPTTLERVQAAHLPELVDIRSVILTGAGTSAYAASAIAASWPGARAIPTTDLLVQSAQDIQRVAPSFAANGLLISLARSGESPESLAVVKRIQQLLPSTKHLAIVCNADGALAHADGVRVICLDPRTNDRSLAMTSSFSNLTLAGLCLVHGDRIAELLPTICRRVADRLAEFNAVADEISRAPIDRLAILASDDMRALATEASLKVLELTAGRVIALPETFLGLRHGPLSFLRDDTPVLCFLSSNPERRRYEDDLLTELRQKRLGRLIVIGAAGTSVPASDRLILANAPDLPDWLRVPFEIPFAQLLAYHLSLRANLNPDNPSPNGAIARVVNPFRIHEEFDGA